MADFFKAYLRTSIYEGGYAFVAGDKGGETYRGIARNFHPYWPGWVIIDEIKKNRRIKYNEIINYTPLNEMVKEFYYKTFWANIRGNDIYSQIIGEFIYDYSVHSGSRRAVSVLQNVLGFDKRDIDGKMGPKTITALNSFPEKYVLDSLKKERLNFLINLSKKPGQAKFRQGWINRVNSF